MVGIGLAIVIASCETPEHAVGSSAVTMPGSGGWPDAQPPDTDAGSGSGGWPDAALPVPDAGSGSGGWPDAELPDAGMFDAPSMDAYASDAPWDAPSDGPWDAPWDAPSDGPEGDPPTDKDGKVIPGWKGKIPLPTPAGGQWWRDTDGVDPAIAGCHYAFTTENKCKASDTVVGWIGEECKDGLLVETNPEADKCHEHANATGHPDTYDCDLYCKGKGKPSGKCVAVPKFCDGPTGAKTLASARCECD